MKSHSVANVVLFSLLVSTGAIAGSFKVTGSIPASVELKSPSNTSYAAVASVQPRVKQISLERIELSKEASDYLAKLADDQPTRASFATAAASTLPASAELGMNNLPVLDQGQHGTCVTFAVTGAIDAVRGNSDYISQLCNLELGSYLESKDANYPSGWEGSLNEIVLGQIQKYGIVTMAYQKQYGCGSTKVLKDYPLNDENNTGSPITPVEFAKHSEAIMKDIYAKTLLNPDDAFSPKANMETVLKNVKQAIVNGHRVVFGTLLDVTGDYKYINGAAGTFHNVKNDAWIVTAKVKSDLKAKRIDAGHAMVITGYDDNAEIVGADGSKHRGVLTLRNSWSDQAGEKGSYYMSYEFFKLLADEAEEISPTPLQ